MLFLILAMNNSKRVNETQRIGFNNFRRRCETCSLDSYLIATRSRHYRDIISYNYHWVDKMNKKDILYLGSQSASRQKLLRDAQIPFKTLDHASDEQIDVLGLSFEEHVLAIAQSKIRSLVLPDPKVLSCHPGQGPGIHLESIQKTFPIFVLTADTLIRLSKTGTIMGKPTSRDHARSMLEREAQEPLEIITGCCLEKMYNESGTWVTREKIHWTTGAMAEFVVSSDQIDAYLDAMPMAMYCCGAGMVEGFGAQFLKSINGSYSAVIGLPMFELKEALKKLKFNF